MLWGKTVMLKQLFARKPVDPTDALYAEIVAAARQPRFYAQWGVPDTIDGRFDMLALHMFLVLDRLHRAGEGYSEFTQLLTNRFFAEMDAALREVGVGDLVVGKKVRKMAEAFYGRVTAYRAGLREDGDTLRDAIARNIYAGTDASHAQALANWVRAVRTSLQDQEPAAMTRGEVRFT
jgi:cytochrome b pre-mRNA-processing protein 3